VVLKTSPMLNASFRWNFGDHAVDAPAIGIEATKQDQPVSAEFLPDYAKYISRSGHNMNVNASLYSKQHQAIETAFEQAGESRFT